jgi:hypothetical protein
MYQLPEGTYHVTWQKGDYIGFICGLTEAEATIECDKLKKKFKGRGSKATDV